MQFKRDPDFFLLFVLRGSRGMEFEATEVLLVLIKHLVVLKFCIPYSKL